MDVKETERREGQRLKLRTKWLKEMNQEKKPLIRKFMSPVLGMLNWKQYGAIQIELPGRLVNGGDGRAENINSEITYKSISYYRVQYPC